MAATDEFLRSPWRMQRWGTVLLLLGLWFAWTLWTDAYWTAQIIFLCIAVPAVLVVAKPEWLVYLMILILVCDISNWSDYIQIPGFIGLAALGGKVKIPELLSLFAVFHLALSFLLRRPGFGRPLVGRVMMFLIAGLMGTGIGLLHHYVPSNVLRDSLGYYFSIFYVVGALMMTTILEARAMFRVFLYATVFAACGRYLIAILDRSTGIFYTGSGCMFLAFSAYYMLTRLYSNPSGSRKWLALFAALFFSLPSFLGRTRTGVLGFLVGVIPILFVLRPSQRVKLVLGVLIPVIAAMLWVFYYEASVGTTPFQRGAGMGARGLTVFTHMGEQEYDPTGNYRLYMWGLAWNGFVESPVLGKGYGWLVPVVATWRAWSEEGAEMPAAVIHNSFLHVLACNGLLGFLPLLAIVFGYFGLCWRELRKSRTTRKKLFCAWAIGIGAMFFFASSANVTLETVNSGIIGWLMLAIGARVARATDEELEVFVNRRIVSPLVKPTHGFRPVRAIP